MLLLALLSFAASAQGWRGPNALVGVGIAPWGPAVRGEAWMATEITGELGLGVRDLDPSAPVADWALRWRPRFACFGCEGRALATVGLGVGGTVAPDLSGGPWALGVGPDFAATAVYWASGSTGLQVTGRAGFGPTVLTDAVALGVYEPWFMVSAGLAF